MLQMMWTVLLILASFLERIESEQFTIVPGQYSRIVIPANDVVSFITVEDIADDTEFAVIQLHTQRHNISISTEPTFSLSATKTGTSVGMTTLRDMSKISFTWLVRVNGTQNVTAVAYVQIYDRKDPIPGGCNQVFNLELDPSIVLITQHHHTTVWFQWSNMFGSTSEAFDCEDAKVRKNLTYDVYVSYVPQRDFSESQFMDGVESMLRPEDIRDNGVKVYSTKDYDTAKSQISVISQANVGAMYAVVVTRLNTQRQAAYVTAVTYACDFDKGDCSPNSSAEEIIFSVVLCICGLFLLFVGHRFFKITQCVFGFTFASLLGYILLSVPHTIEDSAKLSVAAAIGVVGGCFWLGFWFLVAFPVASVLLQGLCAGYLVASVLFFTPFGNLNWWTTELNYGISFAVVSIAFAIFILNYVKTLSIVSCAVVGSFMFLMCIAIPLQSSLRLIFLNSIYHQTEEDYVVVQVVAPFFSPDIALTTLWPVLAIAGIFFQFYRERGRPAFQLPENFRRRRRIRPQVFRQIPVDEEEDDHHNSSSGEESNDERRRLLPKQTGANTRRLPSYQSVHESSPQITESNQERNFLT